MDIRELRIGNYILFDGKFIKVEELSIFAASYTTKNRINNLPFNYFSPIPLTEEILLKAGFKFVCFYNDDKLYELGKISLFVNGYNESIIKVANVIIASLHHLQNICFDLGQELDIKL